MSFETGTSFVAIDMADPALEFSAIPTTVPQVICFSTIVAASLVRLWTLTVMALVSRHMGWSMWLHKTKCLIQGRQEYPGPLLIKMVFVSSQTGCQSLRYSSSCKALSWLRKNMFATGSAKLERWPFKHLAASALLSRRGGMAEMKILLVDFVLSLTALSRSLYSSTTISGLLSRSLLPNWSIIWEYGPRVVFESLLYASSTVAPLIVCTSVLWRKRGLTSFSCEDPISSVDPMMLLTGGVEGWLWSSAWDGGDSWAPACEGGWSPNCACAGKGLLGPVSGCGGSWRSAWGFWVGISAREGDWSSVWHGGDSWAPDCDGWGSPDCACAGGGLLGPVSDCGGSCRSAWGLKVGISAREGEGYPGVTRWTEQASWVGKSDGRFSVGMLAGEEKGWPGVTRLNDRASSVGSSWGWAIAAGDEGCWGAACRQERASLMGRTSGGEGCPSAACRDDRASCVGTSVEGVGEILSSMHWDFNWPVHDEWNHPLEFLIEPCYGCRSLKVSWQDVECARVRSVDSAPWWISECSVVK